MEIRKRYFRQSLLRILFYMLLLWIVMDGVMYSALTMMATKVVNSEMEELGKWIEMLRNQYFFVYFLPGSALVFLMTGLVIFLSLRFSFLKTVGQTILGADKKLEKNENDRLGKKEQTDLYRRFYLHLLSILQREGRIMDFFAEDLAQYEDAQIGAAVRNVQENCKKVIDKYLAPKEVMSENEGDEVTVAKGFDPLLIKLTGNVTGEPPFKGILRHRGWKVAKLDLPTFSGVQDSRIIAPAEIEII